MKFVMSISHVNSAEKLVQSRSIQFAMIVEHPYLSSSFFKVPLHITPIKTEHKNNMVHTFTTSFVYIRTRQCNWEKDNEQER